MSLLGALALRRPATHLRLDAPVPPERLAERLRRGVVPVRSLLLSIPRGGDEPFVGLVTDSRIAMRVRHGYSNGLTRLFDGRVTRTSFGARLEGRFRTLWWVVAILRLVWLLLLVPSGVYLLDVARHARAGGAVSWSEVAAAAALPGATLALLWLVELWGRWLGDRDEERMRRHLAGLAGE